MIPHALQKTPAQRAKERQPQVHKKRGSCLCLRTPTAKRVVSEISNEKKERGNIYVLKNRHLAKRPIRESNDDNT